MFVVLFLRVLLFRSTRAHPFHVPRQEEPSNPTTLAGYLCASPSCTVTPALFSTLVVRPTAVVVQPPGIQSSITVNFDPITTTNFQPKETVLENVNVDATLTLGEITLSGLKATATTTYNLSPTESSKIVVIAEVEASSQLYFEENFGTCPIDGPFGSNERQSIVAPQSLNKRSTRIVESPQGGPTIQRMLEDAKTVLTAIDARLTRAQNGAGYNSITDKGLLAWFPRQHLDRLHFVVQNQLSILTNQNAQDPANIPSTWTTLEHRDILRDEKCIMDYRGVDTPIAALTVNNEDLLIQRPGQNPERCSDTWTVICPKSITSYKSLSKPLLFCSSTNIKRYRKKLDEFKFDFRGIIASGARDVIHEFMHYPGVTAHVPNWYTATGGNGNNRPQACNTNRPYDQEVYDLQELRRLKASFDGTPANTPNPNTVGPSDMALYNAENYALAIMEWWIRDQCSWN